MGLSEWLWKRRLGGASALISIVFLTSCSSSIFSNDKNSELNHLKDDGRFNKLCLGLDLSKSTLDVPTTRSLLRCLNSNHSIEEFEALIKKLTDEQLGVLLEVVNQEIMLKPSVLRAIDQSWDQMDQRGILNRALDKLSRVLAHGKFVSSAVKLARQGTHGPDGELDPSVMSSVRILAEEISDYKNGKEGLGAARENLDRMLEAGIAMTNLKAFKAAVHGLTPAMDALPGNSLESLLRKAHEYIKFKIDDSQHAYAKVLLWGIVDGSLFEALDHYNYQECDHAADCDAPTLSDDHQVAAMEDFLRMLVSGSNADGTNRETILKPMIDVFHAMNTQIDCMAGTKKIPNGDLFVMDEITRLVPLDVPQWLDRDNTIKLKLANSFCQFPSLGEGQSKRTFNQLFQVMRRLSRYPDERVGAVGFGRPLITVAHFLRGLEVGEKSPMSGAARGDLRRYMNYPENERYRRFMISFLGDASSANVYTHLADALAELAREDRNVLGNALYLMNVPAKTVNGVKPIVARDDLRKVTEILMRARSDIAGGGVRSLFDVMANAVKTVDVSIMIDLAREVGEFIIQPDDLISPLAETTRDALLVNDANPLIDIVLTVARDAENRKLLVQTIFDIAELPEFERALQLTAKMAQNGSLKELIGGTLTLFKGMSKQAPGEATPALVTPARLVGPDRDRSLGERHEWRPLPAHWPVHGIAACEALDFDKKFSDSLGSSLNSWRSQAQSLAACVDANGENGAAAEFIRWGVDREISAGRPMLAVLVDMLADFIPAVRDRFDASRSWTETEIRQLWDEFSDIMIDAQDFADMKAMNRMMPLMFGKRYCPKFEVNEDDPNPPEVCSVPREKLAVMKALGGLTSHLKTRGADLQLVMGAGKESVEHPRLAQAGYLGWDAWNVADEDRTPIVADKKPPIVSYPLSNWDPSERNHMLQDMLDKAIREWEGREPTSEIRAEKIEQFLGQPFSGKQFFYSNKQNRLRRSGLKEVDQLKQEIKPFLDELAQGNRIEWMLAYMYYFDNNPYSPEWWENWFQRLSNEVRPIPYYYPGMDPDKDRPVVRLVSQLDLLELLVIEADFSLNELKQSLGFLFTDPDSNFSIKYLTALADSGRDMKPAIDAMEKETEFFNGLARGILGGALKPEVKRRLFNLQQEFRIMRETDVERPWPAPTKQEPNRVVYLNDLGVLRDLFKAILSATPPGDRHNYRRDKNSLALVTKLVSSGILRNIGTNMWRFARMNNEQIRYHDRDGQDVYQRYVVPNEISQVLRFLVEASVDKTDGRTRRINGAIRKVLGFLLRDDCDKSLKEYKGLVHCNDIARDAWPGASFNGRYVFIGKLVDQMWKWIEDDDAREARGEPRVMTLMKRAGYDLARLVDTINITSEGNRDTDAAAKMGYILLPLLGTKDGTKIVADNFDLIEDVVTSEKTVRLAELMLKYATDQSFGRVDDFEGLRQVSRPLMSALAADDGRVTKAAVDLAVAVKDTPDWKATKATLKWLKRDAEYKQLKREVLDHVGDKVRNWALRDKGVLRPRMQQYLGKHIENGDFRDLTVFIGRNSTGAEADTFYGKMMFMGEQRNVGKLNDFLDLMQRGLQDAYPVRVPSLPPGRPVASWSPFTH